MKGKRVTSRTTSGVIFETDRPLAVAEWAPRTTGVLLRSYPGDRAAGRSEVRFTGVTALCLREHLQGLRVTVARALPDAVTATLGRGLNPAEHLYLVAAGDVSGWIVAEGAHGVLHQLDPYEALSFTARTTGSRVLFSHGSAR
jgi:hypothetical protein